MVVSAVHDAQTYRADTCPWRAQFSSRSRSRSRQPEFAPASSTRNRNSSPSPTPSTSSSMLHKRKQSQDTLSSFGSLTIQPATANTRHGRNGSLSSPLPSPGLPPTATPSHAVEDGGSIKLHPEFQQEGNVLLACKDSKHQIGFTVNGNLIAAVWWVELSTGERAHARPHAQPDLP